MAEHPMYRMWKTQEEAETAALIAQIERIWNAPSPPSYQPTGPLPELTGFGPARWTRWGIEPYRIPGWL